MCRKRQWWIVISYAVRSGTGNFQAELFRQAFADFRLGYSSAIKFMVTGAILLAAVTLDAVSRRRLERAGR